MSCGKLEMSLLAHSGLGSSDVRVERGDGAGIEQDTLWEDSPETLRLHRAEYNGFMQRY